MPKVLSERVSIQPMTYLKEARQGEDSRHYLGRIEGPAADFTKPTRNGRLYSLKLWKNVEKSSDFQEGMNTLTIFGEADHPEERLDTSLKEVAIVLRDWEIREQEGIVWGSFDILDTPNGRILKELLDYGCQIGVSSRGSGEEIVNENGDTEIDPDTYLFIGFDAVVMPAVVKARPKVVESVDLEKTRSLVSSIEEEINNASTKQELDSIISILESVKLPELGSIKESVNKKLNSIESGNDISSKLIADLGESAQRVGTLESENAKLTSQISADAIRIRELRKVIRENRESSNKLRKCLVKAHQQVSTLEQDVVEGSDLFEEYDAKVESLQRELKLMSKRVESLQSQNISLKEKLERKAKSEIQLERVNRATTSLNERISRLQDEVKRKDARLKSALAESNSRKLTEERLTKKVNSLTNAAISIKKQKEIAVESYLRVKSVQGGISSEVIKNRLPKEYTCADIDKVVAELMDRKARLAQMPIALGSDVIKINSIKENVHHELDEEEEQTMAILSSVLKK